jgi:hypothetical protein
MLATDDEVTELRKLVCSETTGPLLEDHDRYILDILVEARFIDPNRRFQAPESTDGEPNSKQTLRDLILHLQQTLNWFFTSDPLGQQSRLRYSITHSDANDTYVLQIDESLPDEESPMTPCVFICYSSADRERVRELDKRIRVSGVQTWLDKHSLLPGHDWDREIRKSLKDCEIVLACLSSSSVTKDGYVQKEIDIALDVADQKPEGHIYLIPVRLEPCVIPPRLSRFQWVDLFEPEGFAKLTTSIWSRRPSEST